MGRRHALAALAAWLFAAEADAQTVVNTGWYYRNLSLVRVNPLGLFNELRVGYRHRLSHRSEPLWQNTHLGLSTTLAFSPAFVRPGLVVDFNPLAILHVFAHYEVGQFLGTFQFVQSYPSARSEYGDALQRDNADRGLNQAVLEQRFTVGLTLQARLDALVLRTQNRLTYLSAGVRDTDRTYYDIWYDILAQNRGMVFANDTDLLVSFPELGFNGGLRYSLVHAIYDAGAFAPGEDPSTANTPTQRLGPFLAYTFRERKHGWFNAPTVVFMANWWISHRYRTGQESSSLLPYLVLGFQFRGD